MDFPGSIKSLVRKILGSGKDAAYKDAELSGRVLTPTPRHFLLSTCLLAFWLWSGAAQAQSADLLVEKSGPASAIAGANVAYNIVVTNLGPDGAVNVVLSDTIPGTMTFVSASQNSGPVFGCATPAVGVGGTITCTIAALASGASANFTFTLQIPPATPGSTSFTNIVTIASDLVLSPDPNEENNSATAATATPSNDADMAITKNGPNEASPGANVAYTINLVNTGPATAQSVQFDDTLPGGMTFVSVIQNSGPAFSCVTPAVGAGGTITCSIASLASGSNASFTLTGNVPGVSTSYTNTATVSSMQDPTIENDSSTVTTNVSSSDLGANMTGPASVNAGAPLAYAITITNNGPDPSNSATTVTNTLPAGATGASGSGSGWACGIPAGGIITCSSNATIASAAAFPILTISMTAPANPAAVQNSATVSSSTDPIPGNNTTFVLTSVIAQADVSITKTGPAVAASGQNIVYTITVTNNGPSSATNVVVSDPTPAGANFVSNSGACAGAFPCNLGALNAGQSAIITSTFSTAGAFIGNVQNTATVIADPADPNGANNTSTVSTNVAAGVDLSITKNASAGPYMQGSQITYTIVVTNAGPGAANAVTVTDVIPAGTAFVSATPTQGSCSGTTTVICNLGTLANGGSATITLRLSLSLANGSVQNTASVSTTSSDTNGANNSATSAFDVGNATGIPTLNQFGLLIVGIMLLLSGMFWKRRRGT